MKLNAYCVISFDDFRDCDSIEATLFDVVVWVPCIIEAAGKITTSRGFCKVSQCWEGSVTGSLHCIT